MIHALRRGFPQLHRRLSARICTASAAPDGTGLRPRGASRGLAAFLHPSASILRLGVMLAGIVVLTRAAVAAGPEAESAAAVERGLSFLAKEALVWKEQKKCASCH